MSLRILVLACLVACTDDEGGDVMPDGSRDTATDVSPVDAVVDAPTATNEGTDGPPADAPFGERPEDAARATCRPVGDPCFIGLAASRDCCLGTTCAADSCQPVCTSHDACATGCCASLRNAPAKVCAPATLCSPPALPELPDGCGVLNVVADDGPFLGEATTDTTRPNSLCNPASGYGSIGAAYSIYNPLGFYGGLTSHSAYAPSATNPPWLTCATTGQKVGRVTKNVSLPQAVDPDALCTALARSGR